DEGVVARGDNQRRHFNPRDVRQRRRAPVVVERTRESRLRCRVQLVEHLQGQRLRKAQRFRFAEVTLPPVDDRDQLTEEVVLVKAIPRLRQQAQTTLEVDGRPNGGNGNQARHRRGTRLAGQL